MKIAERIWVAHILPNENRSTKLRSKNSKTMNTQNEMQVEICRARANLALWKSQHTKLSSKSSEPKKIERHAGRDLHSANTKRRRRDYATLILNTTDSETQTSDSHQTGLTLGLTSAKLFEIREYFPQTTRTGQPTFHTIPKQRYDSKPGLCPSCTVTLRFNSRFCFGSCLNVKISRQGVL